MNEACELIDHSKRSYAHHIVTAVNEALRLSVFKHVPVDNICLIAGLDDLHDSDDADWYKIYRDPKMPIRRFVALSDVVEKIAERFGLYCRCCNRILFAGSDDFSHDSYRRCDTNLRWHWEKHGLCRRCVEELKVSPFPDANDIEDRIMERRIGAPISTIRDFVVNLSFLTPRQIAEKYGITVGQAKYTIQCLRRKKIDHGPAVEKTHRKWKIAYDAMRELGVKI